MSNTTPQVNVLKITSPKYFTLTILKAQSSTVYLTTSYVCTLDSDDAGFAYTVLRRLSYTGADPVNNTVQHNSAHARKQRELLRVISHRGSVHGRDHAGNET